VAIPGMMNSLAGHYTPEQVPPQHATTVHNIPGATALLSGLLPARER
jgi:hypothetical protein